MCNTATNRIEDYNKNSDATVNNSNYLPLSPDAVQNSNFARITVQTQVILVVAPTPLQSLSASTAKPSVYILYI